MKVKTLFRNDLETFSKELGDKILENNANLDVIIGIATGGIYVSRPIQEKFLNKDWNGKYYEVKLSRQSTDIKKKLKVGKILRLLPYFILNLLRNIEVFIMEKKKSKSYDNSKENKIEFSKELESTLKTSKSVLLIDDAIDTGSTILAIKNVIKEINAHIDVKVAVLTVTHEHPFIEPDFMIFGRVILRCPWAEDYKGEDRIE